MGQKVRQYKRLRLRGPVSMDRCISYSNILSVPVVQHEMQEKKMTERCTHDLIFEMIAGCPCNRGCGFDIYAVVQ